MIRVASATDTALVLAGLQALARDLNDPFRMQPAQLERALATGAARAVLAGDRGLALWSPYLSTSWGMTGAFVTDLWVSEAARGQRLGQALLAAVRDQAAAEFGAVFLRLGVYENNEAACRFYERLGFQPKPGDLWLTLQAAALEAI